MTLTVPITLTKQQGIGASSFLLVIHGIEDGQPEAPNLEGEKNLCNLLYELAKNKLISSAHDVSDGGLAVTLAEMVLASERGLSASIPTVFESFAELPGKVVIGTSNVDKVRTLANQFQIQADLLGRVTDSNELHLDIAGKSQSWTHSELFEAYEGTFATILNL